MLRNLSLFGALLAVAACFPDLSQYEGEGDAASGSTDVTSGAPTSAAGSTETSASASPTSSASSGDGGSGAGDPGAGGDATSSGGAPSASTGTSSSVGGGGGAADPCAPPTDAPLVQRGALVEGVAQGEAYAFCMDHAEVTHLEYRAFYNDVVAGNFTLDDVHDDVPFCDWKPTTVDALVPDFIDMFESDWDNTTHPDVPMVNVDICDANAYCAWSGKRLCGGINGLDLGYEMQEPKNEWYVACSHDGVRPYPYNGDDEYDDLPVSECIAGTPDADSCPAYDPDACATGGVCGGWRGLWTEEESGTCGSFTPGIVNLAGNVSEWVGACTADGGMSSGWRCEQRGGSCGGSAPGGFYSACSWAHGGSAGLDAAARSNYFGFRCCWDPDEG